MSNNNSHTTSGVVWHFAAGWLQVACMSGPAPVGTYSTIKSADVTCPQCKKQLGYVSDEQQVSK